MVKKRSDSRTSSLEYEREMTDLPLTTNEIEAWHRNSLVHIAYACDARFVLCARNDVRANRPSRKMPACNAFCAQPTTWKLIDALRKDKSMVKREQLSSGIDSAGNVTLNERHVNIVRVLKKFSMVEPLEFLKAIAVHLVM